MSSTAPRPRVSADDLALAADWLDYYNDGETTTPDGDEDPAALVMFRVAAWLRAEVYRREEEATVSRLAREHGVTPARARAALRRTVAGGAD